MPAPSRRTWLNLAWVFAVLATILNGLVVGYGAIWFQLFGASADAEDYLVSAGGYGAAAVVLLLAVPAVLTHSAPRWLAWLAGAASAAMALFAANSVLASADAEQSFAPINGVRDGIGGVIWGPWTWVLVVLGVRGLVQVVTAARAPSAAPSPRRRRAS